MKIILGRESAAIRKKYIQTFINCELPYYKDFIEKTNLYSDGLYYVGYLWDCLTNASIVSAQEGLSIIREEKSKLYIMWDLHSCKYIYTENYWKYPKEAILNTDLAEFESILESLPEDIYVFDSSFQWTVTFTHEYEKDVRMCHYARKKNV